MISKKIIYICPKIKSIFIPYFSCTKCKDEEESKGKANGEIQCNGQSKVQHFVPEFQQFVSELTKKQPPSNSQRQEQRCSKHPKNCSKSRPSQPPPPPPFLFSKTNPQNPTSPSQWPLQISIFKTTNIVIHNLPENRGNFQNPNNQEFDQTKFQLILNSFLESNKTRSNHPLLIVVDATPYLSCGGYCVNHSSKMISYYSTPTSSMPFCLKNSKDSSEFEMKNLKFALSLWKLEMMGSSDGVNIYTDNCAINSKGHFATKMVLDQLDHLELYKGVKILNKGGMYLNSHSDKETFDDLICPADYLSRGNIEGFVDILLDKFVGYGFENVGVY